MAQVKMKDGFVSIVNNLFEQLNIRDFSKRQIKIINFIIRLSYGCKQYFAIIPQYTSAFETIGIDKQNIKQELKVLKQAKVIDFDDDYTVFKLNKNFDEWAVSFPKKYNDRLLKDLVALNLKSSQNKNCLFLKQELPVLKTRTMKFLKQELSQPHNPEPAQETDPSKKVLKQLNQLNNININFLKSKNINLEFSLVDGIGPEEYEKLKAVYTTALIGNNAAENYLKIKIEEYDIWLSRGKGSENQLADLLVFIKNDIKEIRRPKGGYKNAGNRKENEVRTNSSLSDYDLAKLKVN